MGPKDLRMPGGLKPTALRRLAIDERGTLLALAAIMAVVILALTGAVVDMGLGYVSKAQLSRAVDAGVLAGARNLRSGTNVTRAQALALAEANGVSAADGASIDLGFGQNEEGENTVWMTATRQMPTLFLRAVGMTKLTVGSAATAAVPPVDLVMVLDQSGSLGAVGAWDELQDAARDFVDFFDDDIDQMGLVSFNTMATERHFISDNFTVSIRGDILGMNSVGWTNYGEGLRLAHQQITSGAVRERSAKVVVFFTDGRPTAFRGLIGAQDRIMSIQQTSPVDRLGGYYNDPDDLPSESNGAYGGCEGVVTCGTWSEQPTPPIHAVSGDQIAHQNGRDRAEDIRSEGVYLYAIGLGDSGADPAFTPNHDFMGELANVDGMTDPNQPKGKYYFAPYASQLNAVFNQLAQDLLVRLAQ